jgi:WD40 repeat protein
MASSHARVPCEWQEPCCDGHARRGGPARWKPGPLVPHPVGDAGSRGEPLGRIHGTCGAALAAPRFTALPSQPEYVELSAGRTHLAVSEVPIDTEGDLGPKVTVFPLVPPLAKLMELDQAVASSRPVGDEGDVDDPEHEADLSMTVHLAALNQAYQTLGAKSMQPKTLSVKGFHGAIRALSFSSDGDYLAAHLLARSPAAGEGSKSRKRRDEPSYGGDGSEWNVGLFDGDLQATITAAVCSWDEAVVVWRWMGGRLVTGARLHKRISCLRVRPLPGEAPDSAIVRMVLNKAGSKKRAMEMGELEVAVAAAGGDGSSSRGGHTSPAGQRRPTRGVIDPPQSIAVQASDRLMLTVSGVGVLRMLRLQDDSTMKEFVLMASASAAREVERIFTDHIWIRSPVELGHLVMKEEHEESSSSSASDQRLLKKLQSGTPVWGYGSGPCGSPVQGMAEGHYWVVCLCEDNHFYIVAPRAVSGAEAAAAAAAVDEGSILKGSQQAVSEVPVCPKTYELHSVAKVYIPRPVGMFSGVEAGDAEEGSDRGKASKLAERKSLCLAPLPRGFMVGGTASFVSVLKASGELSSFGGDGMSAVPVDSRPTGFTSLRAFLPGEVDPIRAIATTAEGKNALLVLPGSGERAGMRLFGLEGVERLPETTDNSIPMFGRGAYTHGTAIRGVAGASSQPLMATIGSDRVIRVWGVLQRRSRCTYVAEDDPICVGMHPSGFFLVVGFADGIRVYNVCLGTRVLRLWKHQSFSRVSQATYCRDGGRLLVISGNKAVVLLSSTLEMLSELKGHAATITSGSWSLDGSRIVTVSTDGTVFVWNSRTGKRDDSLSTATRGLSLVAVTAERMDVKQEDTIWASMVAPLVEAQRGAILDASSDPASPSVRVGRGPATGAGSIGTHLDPRGSHRAVSSSSQIGHPLAGKADMLIVSSGVGGGVPGKANSLISEDRPDSGLPLLTVVQRGEVVRLRTGQAQTSKSTDPVVITCIALDNEGGLLFAGTSIGTVRAYRWPLQVDPSTVYEGGGSRSKAGADKRSLATLPPAAALKVGSFAEPAFVELPLHIGPVSGLWLSPDGLFLVSSGIDGAVVMLAVPYSDGVGNLTWQPPPEKDFNHDVTLVDSEGARVLQRKVATLEKETREALNDKESSLKARDAEWLSRMQREVDRLEGSLALERAKNVDLRAHADTVAREAAEEKERILAEHSRELAAMENNHEAKITAEISRFDKLQDEMERMKQRMISDKLEAAKHAAETLATEREQARIDAQRFEEEIVSLKDQIEIEKEKSEVTLRDVEAEYEQELADSSKDASDTLQIERRATAARQQRVTQLQKKLLDAEHHLQAAHEREARAHRDVGELKQRLLEKDEELSSHQRQLDASEGSLREAEHLTMDLRSKNRTLHNTAFVLDHHVSKLKEEQKPMAEHIVRLERSLEHARHELQTKILREKQMIHKQNEWKRQLAAAGTELLSAQNRAIGSEASLKAVLHDVEMLSLLGDEKAVASAAMEMYRKHVKGENLRLSHKAKTSVVDSAMADLTEATMGGAPKGGAALDTTAKSKPKALDETGTSQMGAPADATRSGSAADGGVVAQAVAKQQRAQEAMLELRSQRDAIRRGASALMRQVTAMETVTLRQRTQAVTDNATLLEECNRLRRELESSRAECRRLGTQLGRAQAVSSSASHVSLGTSVQDSPVGSPGVSLRRSKRSDALGARSSPAHTKSKPELSSPPSSPLRAMFGFTRSTEDSEAINTLRTGSVMSLPQMEAQVEVARREVAGSQQSTINLVAPAFKPSSTASSVKKSR